MGFLTGLPIPFLLYDQKMSQKNSSGSVTLCTDHTSVEMQTLVSSHSVSVGRQPLLLPRRLDLLRLPGTKKIHPLCLQKGFRLAAWPILGKTDKERIFSESFRYPPLLEKENCQSVEMLSQKAGSGWCSEQEILNPFSTTSENIDEFLADLFYGGFKFHTLGVYRSAISSNHETVDGFVIVKHPTMAKFMKGVFSLRPPEPTHFVI